jgi:glutamine amidotransferase
MDLARVVRTGALLAAVRDATEPSPDGEAAAAPFASGPWLFSHNGALRGWPCSVAALAHGLPAEELLSLQARNDSAFVWALVLHRLRGGDTPAEALAETVLELAEAASSSRLNLLLTDGETIAATAWGDTLWYLASRSPAAFGAEGAPSTVVASEPYDDDPHWKEVPDRSLLAATRTDVLLTPLKEPTA